jgi:hypothetical protein
LILEMNLPQAPPDGSYEDRNEKTQEETQIQN